MNIFILLSFLIFALLSYKRPRRGVYLILFLLPTYLIRFKISFIPFTFLEGMILILAAIWLFKKIKNKQLIKTLQATSYKLQAIKWPILLFFLAATISIFISSNRLSALGDWRAFFVEPLIFFVIFLDLVCSKKEIRNVFYALGGGAIYLSLFIIYQIFTGYFVPESYLKEGRMTGFFGYPAAVGLYLAPILAMFIGTLIDKLNQSLAYSKKKLFKEDLPRANRKLIPLDLGKGMLSESEARWQQRFSSWKKSTAILQRIMQNGLYKKIFLSFSIITIILSTFALLGTKTEGAYFGVMAAIFLVLMLTPWRWQAIIFSLIFILIILAIPSSRSYIIQKVTFSDVSGDVRLVLWQGTFNALKTHPIFGGGLSGFPKIYQKYKEARHVELLKYPHNIIFNFWSETGIFGLFAFLWLILEFFKKILRHDKLQITNYKLSLLAAMLCLLIYGLLDVPYFKNDLAILFWAIVGLSLI